MADSFIIQLIIFCSSFCPFLSWMWQSPNRTVLT